MSVWGKYLPVLFLYLFLKDVFCLFLSPIEAESREDLSHRGGSLL